jgi:hypothetical protein
LSLPDELSGDVVFSSSPCGGEFGFSNANFLGVCFFFITVVLLVYVPGKLLLLLLKRTVSPLEDVTLASFVGLILSGVIYWFVTFVRQARYFLLWPLAVSAVF